MYYSEDRKGKDISRLVDLSVRRNVQATSKMRGRWENLALSASSRKIYERNHTYTYKE